MDMDEKPCVPMDTERLADFRAKLVAGWLVSSEAARDLVVELLADRDFHAKRAEYFPTVAAAMADQARTIQQVAAAAGWPIDMPVDEPGELVDCVAEIVRERDAIKAEVARLTAMEDRDEAVP